jgi:hypothetical protein
MWKTAIQAFKKTVVKHIQLEINNNCTFVRTRSKNTKQEEEHMLIVLQEEIHLASITRDWQWVSDKTCIMNLIKTN